MLVMQAGADAAAADAATAPATPPQEANIDEGDTSSEWSSDEVGSDEAGGRVAAAGEGLGVRVRVGNGSGAGSDAGSRRAGSIASTYWRLERTDRKEALSAIDEQCATVQLKRRGCLGLPRIYKPGGQWAPARCVLWRWERTDARSHT